MINSAHPNCNSPKKLGTFTEYGAYIERWGWLMDSELKVSKLSPEEIESLLFNKYGSKLLCIDYSRSKKSHRQTERISTVDDIPNPTIINFKTVDE